MEETIVALASGTGRAGVAIIRVSGPAALSVAENLGVYGLEPRKAVLRGLYYQDELLDEAMVLYFSAPASFTGENVIEFHTHGSPAVVQAVISALLTTKDIRLAQPGEFTRRALENDRLDLTQVEGLADLIDAETEQQRKQALKVMRGDLSTQVNKWREDLVHALALITAVIDFADEEVPTDVMPEVWLRLDRVSQNLEKILSGVSAAERIRDGFEVAILGCPNVGKSTLLNALAGREAAITSDIAGTTRDVIEVRLDIHGLPVTFLDTAGLRQSEDAIEKIGVERALERAAAADIRVVLIGPDGETPKNLEIRADDILLRSKSDLSSGDISGKTGEGIEALLGILKEKLSGIAKNASIVIRTRQEHALREALWSLQEARRKTGEDGELDLIAEDLSHAVQSMSSLIGHVGVEDILDDVFSSFCLGK